MDRQVPTLHLFDIVQCEKHLLHVAEVVNLIAVVRVADEDVVLAVFVVEGTLLFMTIFVAEDVDHVGLLANVFIRLG